MHSRTLLKVACLVTLLAGALLAPGCNGGGGGPTTCISFLAGAAPAPSTAIARQAQGSVCDLVVVEIVLTDVRDVFAVDFTASFDASVSAYEGYSLAGSHLTSDGAQVQVLESKQPGQVTLGITRVNPSSGIDFTGSRSLVRLMFRKALASGTGSGALAFSGTKVFGSEQPPREKPGITWSGGTFQVQ